MKLDPLCFAAYNNLGNLFASLKDWETALTFLRAATELNPGSPEIQGNLALLYLKQNEIEPAVESARRAAELEPGDPMYANLLGNALREAKRYDEAEACLRRALLLQPEYAEAYANLGFLYYLQNRPAALIEECYRHAIELKPDLAQAHVNLSHCLLRRGAFAEGWIEHEWRWRWKDFPSPKRSFIQPQWRGEPIRGARILIHAEQGFGDTIQFLRYIPMLAARGARVVFEVHPELESLVHGMSGEAHLIARGDPLPEFDWQCPLMSLPLAFGTDLAEIPAALPYLRVDGQRPEWLRKPQVGGLHVGVVWAGGTVNVIDRQRSLSLEALAPLWELKGASFYSLQRGPARVAAESGPLRFAGLQPQTGDFAATASAVAHLDLVVSVDTSVAHLAGALGKPVWILLPARADWRWLTDREDSPWYPSARLFRQEVDGEWGSVIERVAARLESASRFMVSL